MNIYNNLKTLYNSNEDETDDIMEQLMEINLKIIT